MNVLFIRVSCQKESKTWDMLRRHKFPQVIICGDPNLKENYKLVDDVLYLKCRDSYDALPEKMIASFNALLSISKFDKYDRFLKLDYDNRVRNSCTLKNNKDIIKHDYVGQKIWTLERGENPRGYHFNRVDEYSYWHKRLYEGPMFPYADGGCSYILSRRALELITEDHGFDSLDEVYKKHIYEDMMIGVLLKKYKITPKKTYYYISGDKKITH